MKTKLASSNQKARHQFGGQIIKFGLAVGIAALVAIG